MSRTETMTVRVTEYAKGDPYRAIVRTVVIATRCPVCGGPRGRPHPVSIVDGARMAHVVDQWRNECEHHDLYRDVLVEASDE